MGAWCFFSSFLFSPRVTAAANESRCLLRYAASVLGGPKEGVYFVSHGHYTAQLEDNLGANVTDENFPIDHTVSHRQDGMIKKTTPVDWLLCIGVPCLGQPGRGGGRPFAGRARPIDPCNSLLTY